MRRPFSFLLLVTVLMLPARAWAASGAINDPDDTSLADVLRLAYANNSGKVVMRMTYDGFRPQVENFYVKWGTSGRAYKLQHSEANGTTLWYDNGSSEGQRACDGAVVAYDADRFVSKAVIPRSCMPRARDRVKFQGIVTEGLFESDATRTSTGVARG
jgi:hypothetical protein